MGIGGKEGKLSPKFSLERRGKKREKRKGDSSTFSSKGNESWGKG